ncbi:hypothetical protein EUBHAL_02155 [Anaerobutyricum hallii DSM 3353]|uniref:Uncharacterized protein n=1 Tax=Anaerobutyricum hallii DSM 3353 TaxID=411469 RepID=C0EXL3_9FIRM|nr:hypothetical protein EUBHAL_02155 [Anaerobutyricum hallii DSM 3353]
MKIPKTVRESSEEVIAFGRFFLCRRKCTLLAFFKSGLYNIRLINLVYYFIEK